MVEDSHVDTSVWRRISVFYRGRSRSFSVGSGSVLPLLKNLPSNSRKWPRSRLVIRVTIGATSFPPLQQLLVASVVVSSGNTTTSSITNINLKSPKCVFKQSRYHNRVKLALYTLSIGFEDDSRLNPYTVPIDVVLTKGCHKIPGFFRGRLSGREFSIRSLKFVTVLRTYVRMYARPQKISYLEVT